MSRRIGIAIIGLGAAVLPHARSLLDLCDRVDVRHAVTRSPERAAAFSRDFPFPVATDLAAALADPAVEAVLVLTPPSSHLDVAGLCFEAGRTLSFLDGASETVEFAAGDPRHSGKGELDGPRGSMGQACTGRSNRCASEESQRMVTHALIVPAGRETDS